MLLENNIDIEAYNSTKNTALHYAIVGNKEHCVDILLQAGANPNPGTSYLKYRTPGLLLAIRNESGYIVKRLLEFGADPNAQELSTEDTPLHIAARKGNESLVKRLLAHGANINRTNKLRETPLHVSITHQQEAVIKLLVEMVQISLSVTRRPHSDLSTKHQLR